jgi:hypothetical protein
LLKKTYISVVEGVIEGDYHWKIENEQSHPNWPGNEKEGEEEESDESHYSIASMANLSEDISLDVLILRINAFFGFPDFLLHFMAKTLNCSAGSSLLLSSLKLLLFPT